MKLCLCQLWSAALQVAWILCYRVHPACIASCAEPCCASVGDPESKDDVEADTSGDETDPVDSGHKARDEMFAAVASIRVGY